MIIGDLALIPEDVIYGEKEWVAKVAHWRLLIGRSDGTELELFSEKEAEVDKWLRLVDKAIGESASIRDEMRKGIVVGYGGDGEPE